LVATNIDYQRGERPAKRADGVRELNLFEQVIKDLSGDFQSIITLEAHSPGTAFKCFESDMPILDLTTMPLLVEAADKLRMLGEELVVAVGDEGALEMGVMVQELLTDKKGKEIEIVPGFKQKINNKTQVVFLENDLQKVAGKVVVITEDIVDSGGTMLNTIARLKEGGAKKIIILAPHAVLSTPEGKEGAERLGKQEDVILIMTDSVRGELPEKVAATQKTRQSIYLVDIVDPLLEVVDLDRKGVLRDVYQNKDLRLAHLLLLGFDIAAWANEKYVKVAEKLAEERREAMGIEFEKMGVA
jgi:phosphoribosylpyrophosphate synthetase